MGAEKTSNNILMEAALIVAIKTPIKIIVHVVANKYFYLLIDGSTSHFRLFLMFCSVNQKKCKWPSMSLSDSKVLPNKR